MRTNTATVLLSPTIAVAVSDLARLGISVPPDLALEYALVDLPLAEEMWRELRALAGVTA
jgi:hypothetical protein